MEDSVKYYSEIERYEIININDGEKYNCLSNNDIVIDEEGNLRLLLINNNKSRFGFFASGEIMEIPWEKVNKIGLRTIIIDADESTLKRTKL